MTEAYESRLNRGVSLLKGARSVVAFTGAGISTESGLSDFRSPGGVWDRHRVVTFQEFVASGEARVEYWKMKAELFGELVRARPNRAHTALAELARRGRLTGIITQNIDGLHQDAGNPPETVIELHGTNRRAACIGCGREWAIEEIQERLEEAGFDPRCDVCGEPVKPATVSFGQAMPEDALRLASTWAAGCDLMLMIGSSLQVEPAASLPPHAQRSGASLFFVNRTETPWDHLAAVLFREDAGPVLGDLLERLVEAGGGGERPVRASG